MRDEEAHQMPRWFSALPVPTQDFCRPMLENREVTPNRLFGMLQQANAGEVADFATLTPGRRAAVTVMNAFFAKVDAEGLKYPGWFRHVPAGMSESVRFLLDMDLPPQEVLQGMRAGMDEFDPTTANPANQARYDQLIDFFKKVDEEEKTDA